MHCVLPVAPPRYVYQHDCRGARTVAKMAERCCGGHGLTGRRRRPVVGGFLVDRMPYTNSVRGSWIAASGVIWLE